MFFLLYTLCEMTFHKDEHWDSMHRIKRDPLITKRHENEVDRPLWGQNAGQSLPP